MKIFFILPFILAAMVSLPSIAMEIPLQEGSGFLNQTVPVLKKNPENVTKKQLNTKTSNQKLTAADYYKEGREAYLQFSGKGLREAIEQFNKALALNSKFSPAIAAKAEAEALLSRIIYQVNDDETIAKLELSAFEDAYIAADLSPDLSETHRALSMVYFIQQKYPKGKTEAEKALEINPNDAEAYLLLWLNNPNPKIFKNEDYMEENYYKVLDLNSDVIEKAYQLNPDLVLLYLELGTAYAHQNKYFDAVKSFKMAVKLSPENEEAHASLGALYNLNDLYLNDAIKQFNEALRIEPQRYDAIYGLGDIYLKKMERVKALEYFDKACVYDFEDSCSMVNGSTGLLKKIIGKRSKRGNQI